MTHLSGVGEISLRDRAGNLWRNQSIAAQLGLLGVGVGTVLAFAASTTIAPHEAIFVLLGAVTSSYVTALLARNALRSAMQSAEVMTAIDETNVAGMRIGTCAETDRLAQLFDRVALGAAERQQIMESEMLQLREVERMKDDFVSTVSHELRTPLTSVRGALALVLAGKAGADLPPKARELLRIASQNAERLIRLINDILDVEKIEGGHVELHRAPCDLGDIIRSTVAGLQGLSLESGVRLVVEGEEHVEMSGDSDRLVQVFTNLVSNAIKFSPRGETVRVRLIANGSTASVHVSDRGCGIPAEFRDRIFGKFQQALSPTSGKGGTGLGLAIARAITELHDGTISFETAANLGTTFTVDLPCIAAEVRPEEADDDRYRILVVDDDDSMRRILAAVCAPLGSVVIARSTDEAMTLAKQTRFDAFLLDPGMQDDAGLDLVRRLRVVEAYRNVPVITFSSREYASEQLSGVVLAPTHAFVKSRDRVGDVVMRLRAVLTVRRPRQILKVA